MQPMQYHYKLLRHLRLTIGQDIHNARIKQKITLRKLSQRSGIPEHLLDQYELGKNDITLEEWLKIACALNIRKGNSTLFPAL
jgi:transcriptional regulator with XRE-family HTH domain